MNPRLRATLPLVFILAVAALALSPVVRASFVNWDDPSTLYRNPHINPPALSGLRHIWTNEQGHLYIPITYSLWWFTAHVAHTPTPAGPTLNPHVYHTLNLFLHLASTTTLFILLRRLFTPTAAFFGAALFALHPVQVETVAWASGAKDLLSAFFSLAALCSLFNGRTSSAAGTGVPAWDRPTTRAMALSTLLFLLALLSKPSAITLPFIAAALLFWRRRAAQTCSPTPEYTIQDRKPCALPLLWLLLSLPILIIGMKSQTASLAPFKVPFESRPAIAADALAFYLSKLLRPLQLAPDYGRSPLHALTRLPVFLTSTITLLVASLLFLFRKHTPTLALAALILFLATFPVLGFVPFDFQDYSTVADHYLYLALLGPSLALAAFMTRAQQSAAIGMAAILLILALLSFRQARVWSDTVTLFSHNLTVNPRSGLSHVNAAIALAESNRLTEAERHYRAALRLGFTNASAHLGLAKTLALRGQGDRALAHLETALRLDPDNPLAHFNHGILLSQLNRDPEAIAAYRIALRVDPDYADAHTNLATLLLLNGDPHSAITHYSEALRIDPSLRLPRLGMEEARKAIPPSAPRE